MDVPEKSVLEFRLPDLGEGLTEAELVSWTVAVGDRVELNQTIAEVETAKAQVELPSPFAGEVVELLATPGDTVPVGSGLIRISVTEQAGQATQTDAVQQAARSGRAARPVPAAQAGQSAPAEHADEPAQRTAVLVGYGPDSEFTSRRRRPTAAGPSLPQDPDITSDSFSFADFPGRRAATPGARKLARELGIVIDQVPGSGPGGAVTVDDVRQVVPVAEPPHRISPEEQALVGPRPAPPPVPPMRPAAAALRVAPADRETRAPVSGVRKRTAAAMAVSATIPQATVYATTDVTASVELMDHLRGTDTFAGLTLSPLALVARAALAALEEFPSINSVWDEEHHEIVTKHFVNLGIAVATERGLLVPSVKEAQALSLRELCREIGWLADVCRTGAATPADLRGGTFTISNIGVFGVDSGAALINPGEGAILSLGTIRKRPWVYRDELAVRWVTTLGVSFDHRIIDGEQAARFLSNIAASLEDPLTLLGR